MKARHGQVMTALLLAMMATSALAHPGADGAVAASVLGSALGGTSGGMVDGVPGGALLAGLLHPLTGLDHMLALAAAGLWSARQAAQGPGAGRWAVFAPAVLLAMLAGAVAGMAGLTVPGLETGLAATVAASGLLVAASAVRLPPVWAMALFGAFSALHGNAHGLELPVAATAGYMAGSALLLQAGRILGAQAPERLARATGAGVAAAGLLMLA